jgi:hypothetical protein
MPEAVWWRNGIEFAAGVAFHKFRTSKQEWQVVRVVLGIKAEYD